MSPQTPQYLTGLPLFECNGIAGVSFTDLTMVGGISVDGSLHIAAGAAAPLILVGNLPSMVQQAVGINSQGLVL